MIKTRERLFTTCSAAAFVALFVLLSCQRKVSPEYIAGAYDHRVGDALSRVTLSESGTYVHEYRNQGSDICSSPEKWTLEHHEGFDYVVLENATFKPGEMGGRCLSGFCMLQVRAYHRDVYLVYDSDLGIGYQKVK